MSASGVGYYLLLTLYCLLLPLTQNGTKLQTSHSWKATNDIILNITIAGYLDCIYTSGFPCIFFLIKKRSKKIKLKIGNCCAPFTNGFTCVVPTHRTSNPSFIIADFQQTVPTLMYTHRTTIEIYTLRSKKCHSHFNEKFFPMARPDI